jgi:hypothetical protein
VIAAQRPTGGLDRPTTPKVAVALSSSVMTITKERISPSSAALDFVTGAAIPVDGGYSVQG